MIDFSEFPPQTQGVPLFSKGDLIEFYSSPSPISFECESKIISGLGSIRLVGGRGAWVKGTLGIDLTAPLQPPQLAQKLTNEGKYDLSVLIDQFAGGDRQLVCIMNGIPQDNTSYSSDVHIGEDTAQPDRTLRYSAYTGSWKKPNSNNKYQLFLPANPNTLHELLSQLRFGFKSIPKPQTPISKT